MDNQNECVVGVTRYVTRDSGDGCVGCAAANDWQLCNRLLPCSAREREDGRQVIWIDAGVVDGGEA